MIKDLLQTKDIAVPFKATLIKKNKDIGQFCFGLALVLVLYPKCLGLVSIARSTHVNQLHSAK